MSPPEGVLAVNKSTGFMTIKIAIVTTPIPTTATQRGVEPAESRIP